MTTIAAAVGEARISKRGNTRMILSTRVAGLISAGVLTGCAGFQAALALGAPWGAAAYGGSHRGQLPIRLRMVSAAVVPLYVGIAGSASGAWGSRDVRMVVTRAGAACLAISVPLNLASPSLPERRIWPIVGAVGAITLWRAVPRQQRRRP